MKINFIEKAMLVHGTKYDYSKVDLSLPFKTKVEIICPKHGSFFQRKDSHTGGAGCRKCVHDSYVGNYKYTTESFIEQVKLVNKEDLLYDKVVFKGTMNKVIVTCPKHGDYQVKADSLLKGYGCQKCYADKQRTTLEDFKNKANKVHANFYDYSECDDISESKQKLKIICPTHGSFYQCFNSHLSGKGCRKCATEKNVAPRRLTNDEFISRCSEIHKGKYDYSLVELDGVDKPVKILCPVHGEYKQLASSHLTGRGCKLCRNDLTTYNMVDRYIKNEELGSCLGLLYVAKMSGVDEEFLKIGITSNWKGRRKQYNKIKDTYSFQVLHEFKNTNLSCAILEKELFRYLKSLGLKYKPKHNFVGRRECFLTESLECALEFINNFNFEI